MPELDWLIAALPNFVRYVFVGFALAALTGCPSPSDLYCVETAKCLGEKDPEQYCKDAAADRNEEQQACADKCKAENDALAQCCLDNGECDEIEGTDTKVPWPSSCAVQTRLTPASALREPCSATTSPVSVITCAPASAASCAARSPASPCARTNEPLRPRVSITPSPSSSR